MATNSPPVNISQHRCPNCGTRVAKTAETCFMCGHDLQGGKIRRRRVSWLDALLVIVILAVITIWWRSASQPEVAAPAPVITIPSQVDLPTATPTATPAPTATATPRPAPTPFMHQVQSGETLLSIAGKYGVTVEDLQSANGLSDVLIRIGEELYIPQNGVAVEAGGTGETTLGDGSDEEASVFTYEVKPGDTVVSIAIRFGTTVEAILTANKMTPTDFIQPQQTLLVPVGDLPSEVLDLSDTITVDPTSSTDGQQTVYAAVRLLGPADRGELSIDDATLFRWLSVDILQPNEWYVLRIWSADGVYPDPPSVWTKATSHRLTPGFGVENGVPAQFRWQISVVRVLADQGAGRELQAASFPSDIRSLTWQ